MKLKKTVLVLSTLPFFLAACGGGGGDDVNSQNLDQNVSSYSTGINESIFQISNATKQYKEYAFQKGVVPNTEYTTRLNETEYLLTSDKIYNNEWVKADIKSNSRTSIFISSAPNVSETSEFKIINLSNKDVYDVVYPGFKTYFAFDSSENNRFSKNLPFEIYKKKPTLKFSTGATCYQKTNSTVKGGYIRFDLNSPKNKKHSDNLIDFAKYVEVFENGLLFDDGTRSPGYLKLVRDDGNTVRIVEGKWAGYEWKYYREFDQFGLIYEFVLLNNKGILVEADMVDFEGYDLEQNLSERTGRLNSIEDKNSEEYQNLIFQLNYTKAECAYFNKAAHENIRSLFNL